jgi:hypothetical protein
MMVLTQVAHQVTFGLLSDVWARRRWSRAHPSRDEVPRLVRYKGASSKYFRGIAWEPDERLLAGEFAKLCRTIELTPKSYYRNRRQNYLVVTSTQRLLVFRFVPLSPYAESFVTAPLPSVAVRHARSIDWEKEVVVTTGATRLHLRFDSRAAADAVTAAIEQGAKAPRRAPMVVRGLRWRLPDNQVLIEERRA